MAFESVRDRWEPLLPIDATTFSEARLQCHWAVQALQALAEARVPPRPDFSHLSLSWNPDERCFEGQPTETGVRARMRPEGLSLSTVGPDGAGSVTELSLRGRTLDEALAWLSMSAPPGDRTPSNPLRRPDHELPPHPVAEGRPFTGEPAGAFAELARWYDNAHRFLEHVRTGTPGASPVRVWPHHFDMATLITLDHDAPDPEKARSIGVGLSPGDPSYAEPYFYVNPWPPPTDRPLPPLDGEGHWHREGWLGAVLPASDLTSTTHAMAQAERVHRFAESGIRSSIDLLGATDPRSES